MGNVFLYKPFRLRRLQQKLAAFLLQLGAFLGDELGEDGLRDGVERRREVEQDDTAQQLGGEAGVATTARDVQAAIERRMEEKFLS